jgi:hypothetical protein
MMGIRHDVHCAPTLTSHTRSNPWTETPQAAINCAVPMPLQTKDGLYLQWLDKALKESFARFQA